MGQFRRQTYNFHRPVFMAALTNHFKAAIFDICRCNHTGDQFRVQQQTVTVRLPPPITDEDRHSMNSLHLRKAFEATEKLWALANGPFRLNAKCYSGCMVNEVWFHTKDRDTRRTTQNSGLVVEVLFECEWFYTGNKKTIQVDKHFISIDVSSRWYKNDPFVLPIQVQQVFYINDIKFGKNWQLVQRVQHRHLWELLKWDIEDDCDGSQTHAMSPLQQFESIGVSQVVEGAALTNLVREDVEPVILDENTYKEIWHTRHLRDEDDEELHSEEGFLSENDTDEEEHFDEDSDNIDLEESEDDDLGT
ncbi:hypothetical protein BUALT_Bualt09G0016600 [Buddleja alternifolia]|uniref:DUF4216 domain-containing protein n=1 Tax=Buddleja alternifolia TaxID=168488 RepID=A0AAV6X6C4_9LAMI|nr:hypothetical protein BUALT_Bualt09G0016600 [Buddleja alternifolia]